MNRIKFRFWDLENKRWIEDWNGSSLFLLLQGKKGTYSGAENKVVPQIFTNLFDKNEKEIYEGDIVKLESKAFSDDPVVGEVKFLNCAFLLFEKKHELSLQLGVGMNLEIIGNIFENTELLK